VKLCSPFEAIAMFHVVFGVRGVEESRELAQEISRHVPSPLGARQNYPSRNNNITRQQCLHVRRPQGLWRNAYEIPNYRITQ